MSKKGNKKSAKFPQSWNEALSIFDLKIYKQWLKKNHRALWVGFESYSEECQMAIMCQTICNRTDMLSTETHKKALAWLKEHNMKGRLF